MRYKIEVISTAANTKHIYVDTLEEVTEQKKLIRKELKEKLKFEIERHEKDYECNDETCRTRMRIKINHEVRFKVYIARWEVIG